MLTFVVNDDLLFLFNFQAWVSIKRLDMFLNAEELDPECVSDHVSEPDSAVEVEDGTFSWDQGTKPILEE